MIGRLFRKKNPSDNPSEEHTSPEPGRTLPFTTDLHSHLIPGIDDGSPDLSTSLDLLRRLEEVGYRRLVITPHVMADSYRNSTRTILEGLERLKAAAAEAGIGLELHAAAEYYLDEEFFHRLERGDLLTIGERWVLFETSYYNEPLGLEERIYEITARGYRPMLAHPERYRYVRERTAFYGRLREMGVGFQVNINSLGGYYGRDAREKAEWLAERGWIDFLGSDTHGAKQVEFLQKTIREGRVERVLERNSVGNDHLVLD